MFRENIRDNSLQSVQREYILKRKTNGVSLERGEKSDFIDKEREREMRDKGEFEEIQSLEKEKEKERERLENKKKKNVQTYR